MDDYMDKPGPAMATIREKLGRWLDDAVSSNPQELRQAAPHPRSAAFDAPSTTLDLDGLTEVFGSREEATAMLDRFLEANQQDMTALDNAVEVRNADRVARVAHRMQGRPKLIGETNAAELAVRLERAGREERWPAIESALESFHSAIGELDRAVRELPR